MVVFKCQVNALSFVMESLKKDKLSPGKKIEKRY